MKVNYTRESQNYFCNGEDKHMTYKKVGYYSRYEYKTNYMHGTGNNISGLIHHLMKHGNMPENVSVYKNGKLLKEWQR